MCEFNSQLHHDKIILHTAHTTHLQIRCFSVQKELKFFLFLHENLHLDTHLKHLGKVFPISTHNICFHRELSINFHYSTGFLRSTIWRLCTEKTLITIHLATPALLIKQYNILTTSLLYMVVPPINHSCQKTTQLVGKGWSDMKTIFESDHC